MPTKKEFGATFDISERDRAHLMRNGFNSLLKNPTSNIISQSIIKDKLNFDLEKTDPMQASNIQFSFVGFRPPQDFKGKLPTKFMFKMRFFTFSEVVTDIKQLELDEFEVSRPFRSD